VTDYLLLHGASSDSWYWHLVAPRLTALGHRVIAPDLPCDQEDAGLPEYRDAALAALADRDPADELVVVAQSLSGFVGPLVAAAVPTRLLVLVCAMVPRPGESAGQWWEATGYGAARQESDAAAGLSAEPGPDELFFADVPEAVTKAAFARGERGQTGGIFAAPWPLPAWPDVPTRVLVGRRDRFFPLGFQRRVVADRLGFAPDEIDTGHLPALVDPAGLVERLEAYRTELTPTH
jgi:pimeloyl-ACP methyl ester carboxylesterase